MSMSIIFVPLAIALCATASETIQAVRQKCKEREDSQAKGMSNQERVLIQTRFSDLDLLNQTLSEHGLNVTVVDANNIMVHSPGGTLRYTRNGMGNPFLIELVDIADMDCLVNDLEELETEYDCNVQTFTYNRIVQNLPEDMTIVEDTVLEDDSLLLRLAVNE